MSPDRDSQYYLEADIIKILSIPFKAYNILIKIKRCLRVTSYCMDNTIFLLQEMKAILGIKYDSQ